MMTFYNKKGNIVKKNWHKFLVVLSVFLASVFSTNIALADDNVDYLLGAGDTIRINVFQNPELTTETRVSESGSVSFPLVGEVKVGGKSIQAAEKAIAQGLIRGKYVQQPQVNIVLLAVRGNQVAVMGMVNKPGRYPLETFNIHLSEAIAIAGGVAPQAGNGKALLSGTRNGQPYKHEVELAALFLNDKKSEDVVVTNGDIIYVVPGNQISILGQVLRPGRFALDTYKMNLVDALSLSGGMIPTASDSVVITGMRDGSAYRQEVNVSDLFMNQDAANDVQVMAGDQIYVHRAPVYYIYGEAQKSGSYRVERNMTVIQALAQGGGPTIRGTQRNIKLWRRNEEGTVEKTSPKLTDPVKAEDVIFVEESLF